MIIKDHFENFIGVYVLFPTVGFAPGQHSVLLPTVVVETVGDAEVGEECSVRVLQPQLAVPENQEEGVVAHRLLPGQQFEALLRRQRQDESALSGGGVLDDGSDRVACDESFVLESE